MTASASQLTLHPKQNFISAILAILSFFWEWYLIFLLRFGILLLVTLVTHCGTTRMYYAKSECLILLWCFHTAKSCIRLVWNQHKHNIFSLPPQKSFLVGRGQGSKANRSTGQLYNENSLVCCRLDPQLRDNACLFLLTVAGR